MSSAKEETTPESDHSAVVIRGGDAIQTQRQAVRSMFDRVSGRYDLLNRLLSFGLDGGWRRRAVQEMELPSAGSMLDVACGTGDLGLEASRSMKGGRVVGVDFASAMLALGKRKGERPGSPRMEFLSGAAEALPFGDNTFDAVGIAFGIRNIPERTAALSEMKRVVRPGGRIVILELTTARQGLIPRLVRLYTRFVLPIVGRILSKGEAYEYLSSSMDAFPPPESFLKELGAAGLEDVSSRPLPLSPTWIFAGTVPDSPSE